MQVSWREMLDRLNKIDIVDETRQVVEDTQQPIIELVQSQLIHGEDADGAKLRPYKNSRYAAKKHQMNGLAGLGTPDMKVTGRLYSDMGIDAGDNEFSIVSLNPILNYLVLGTSRGIDPFGEKSVMLQDKNKNVYRAEYLYPRLRQAIKRVTNT